jgi:predicted CopG family antitoxin
MATIDIDFDVYKALTLRRATEDTTYNDVLRELLRLGPKQDDARSAGTALSGKGDWVPKGVRFPLGTEFRANHKGENYYGKVEDGALVVNGKRFDSPSAAAVAITGNPVNGWMFWECRLPGKGSWQMLKTLRK